MKTISTLSVLLEKYFTDRLMRQLQASPSTIASYRDTFCLLFAYAQECLGKKAASLKMEDLNSSFIVNFLCWLEKQRGNSARTRNTRLAAIHSFFQFVALYDPIHSELIQRVLAIPGKRHEKQPVTYLNQSEVEALLVAPDLNTWGGRRDRTLMTLAVQTGLRVSELTGLNCEDINIENGPHVYCMGKGRKERCTPLRKESIPVIQAWLSERNGCAKDPLFPNARGTRLSRDGIEYILKKHAIAASNKCPSLLKKHVSPHVLRHTAAMDLLRHGVDRSVIALWLGHETLETVNVYLHADMQIKEKAMEKTTAYDIPFVRYRPDDELLAFLKSL